jgi:nucleotide-binding universal stress UspA family protein
MSFRKLLVPVERPKTARTALRYALELARELDAHVEVFHPQLDPALVLPPELLTQAQRSADELHAEIKAMIEGELASLGCSDIARGHKAGFSISFETAIGSPERLAARRGRIADVTIVARAPHGSRGESDCLAGALWASARPVILVPGTGDSFTATGKRPERIVVAWNGSAEASRAVAAALPMLVQAVAVEILTIDNAVDREALDRVRDYFLTHGIQVTTKSVASNGETLAKVLIDRVVEREADMIVMGAYTHSRLREYLLGGLTQQVMDGAPVPVLLAH